jgi:hypothetical protein
MARALALGALLGCALTLGSRWISDRLLGTALQSVVSVMLLAVLAPAQAREGGMHLCALALALESKGDRAHESKGDDRQSTQAGLERVCL